MAVYSACILTTLLYGSESWTFYSGQGKRLDAFHMRSLQCVLGIRWSYYIPNTEVLTHTGITSMFTLLMRSQLHLPGHVNHLSDGRIPKDLLYSALASSKRRPGCPFFGFKDVCKWDKKALDIDNQQMGRAHWWPGSMEVRAWQHPQEA